MRVWYITCESGGGKEGVSKLKYMDVTEISENHIVPKQYHGLYFSSNIILICVHVYCFFATVISNERR